MSATVHIYTRCEKFAQPHHTKFPCLSLLTSALSWTEAASAMQTRFVLKKKRDRFLFCCKSNLGATWFHFRRAAVLNQLKSKCGLLLAKAAALRVTLNTSFPPRDQIQREDPVWVSCICLTLFITVPQYFSIHEALYLYLVMTIHTWSALGFLEQDWSVLEWCRIPFLDIWLMSFLFISLCYLQWSVDYQCCMKRRLSIIP